jgi:hypothetical protein
VPHILSAIAIGVGRVVAGVIGALALYVAFFMYENEEGIWQNRLDELWVSIDDRSKLTDRKSTALFNSAGQVLTATLNRLLGTRLWSFKAVGVSIDLSLGVSLLVGQFLSLFLGGNGMSRSLILGNVASALVLLAFGSLPLFFKKQWSTLLCFLPVTYVLGIFLVRSLFYRHAPLPWSSIGKLFLAPIVISVASDLWALTSIRRLFHSIAEALSLSRVISIIGGLLFIVLIVLGIPLWLNRHPSIAVAPFRFHPSSALLNEVSVGASIVMWFNVSTALLCLAILAVLTVVLMHKLIWPTLARPIYSAARYRLITNRKALVSIGGLCLAIAFNLKKVGLGEILKLVGH